MTVKINMEMPKGCIECRFHIDIPLQSYCVITDYWTTTNDKKPSWCPLQEVKE